MWPAEEMTVWTLVMVTVATAERWRADDSVGMWDLMLKNKSVLCGLPYCGNNIIKLIWNKNSNQRTSHYTDAQRHTRLASTGFVVLVRIAGCTVEDGEATGCRGCRRKGSEGAGCDSRVKATEMPPQPWAISCWGYYWSFQGLCGRVWKEILHVTPDREYNGVYCRGSQTIPHFGLPNSISICPRGPFGNRRCYMICAETSTFKSLLFFCWYFYLVFNNMCNICLEEKCHQLTTILAMVVSSKAVCSSALSQSRGHLEYHVTDTVPGSTFMCHHLL